MKRKSIAALVLIFSVIFIIAGVALLVRPSGAGAQSGATPAQKTAAQTPAPAATTGQPATDASRSSPTTTPSGPQFDVSGANEQPIKYSLDCAGCHGEGKSLPYLAGETFHKDAHGAWEQGVHAKAATRGVKAATCLDCHSPDNRMVTMLPKNAPDSTINRANITRTCGKCHNDSETMRGGGSGVGSHLFVSYMESVHAKAVARGKLSAAVCTDCHNSHDVRAGNDTNSPIFKFNIPQTCGQCHASETTEFMRSVHGTSIGRGNSQSPTCTDCHGIHGIGSLAATRDALRTNTCSQCHDGVRLSREFGIAGGRVSSFKDSYHGLAKRLGSNVVADCASCHGVHDILPSSNPASMIAPANLRQTCGQCHPGAGEAFIAGKVHLDVPVSQDAGSTGVRWVRWVYLGLIFGTIGGMGLHNVLAWRKKAAAKLRREKRSVVRLTRNQRIQHWLLLTSFTVLVISGFVLVYPDSFFYYLALGTSEATRRLVHRVAGVVMMIVGIYHIIYLLATAEGRKWLVDMMPRWKDVQDLLQFFRHYLLGSGPRPKFERFGYAEKAEYWAVVWGTVVMGLTGLLIWLKTSVFTFAPLWWIDIAIAIHFYEAVLATLAIIVWHFYHVFLDPDVYPVNFAFYDGRMSEEMYRHEHELDWERMQQSSGVAETDDAEQSGAPGEDETKAADADASAETAADKTEKQKPDKGEEPAKGKGFGTEPTPAPGGGD